MGFLTADDLCRKYGIALTGGIGAGKTTVSKLIEDLGYSVISADQLARDAVLPETEGYKKIIEAFGSTVLDDEAKINRKKLRDLVFNNDALRRKLETITHPLIRRELSRQLEILDLNKIPKVWFYEAPIIVEAGRQDQFRELWLLACPTQIRLQRIIKRDSLDEDKALKILSSQMSDQEKARFASVVIDSSQTLNTLACEVAHNLERLRMSVLD